MPMKILLAEDEDALRASFVRQLQKLGHDVHSWSGGNDLVEALQAGERGDLVWTDLAMPDGDGFAVIRATRAMLPGVPIVVVSAHGDAENILAAFRLGADNFLTKPYEATALHAVLHRIDDIRAATQSRARAFRSITRANLEIRLPADVGVAAATAELFAEHARAFLDDDASRGLQIAAHEILLNAVEHGCLEITKDEKLSALADDSYAHLFTARRADPRLGTRVVDVRFVADEGGVTITVTDRGPGFDPSKLPDPSDPENLFLPSGRGILMARVHVDELRYEDGGRRAVIVVKAGR